MLEQVADLYDRLMGAATLTEAEPLYAQLVELCDQDVSVQAYVLDRIAEDDETFTDDTEAALWTDCREQGWTR